MNPVTIAIMRHADMDVKRAARQEEMIFARMIPVANADVRTQQLDRKDNEHNKQDRQASSST